MTPEQAERLVEALESIAESLEGLGLIKDSVDDQAREGKAGWLPAWLVYLRNISWGRE